MTTSSGSASPVQQYEPYGTPSNGALSSLTSQLFTGQYRDGYTGLQYHRARWLDTVQGRWYSQDPVFDFPANFGNGYRCFSSVGNVDPSGMFSMVESLSVAKMLVALTTVNLASFILGSNDEEHLAYLQRSGGALDWIQFFTQGEITIGGATIALGFTSAMSFSPFARMYHYYCATGNTNKDSIKGPFSAIWKYDYGALAAYVAASLAEAERMMVIFLGIVFDYIAITIMEHFGVMVNQIESLFNDILVEMENNSRWVWILGLNFVMFLLAGLYGKMNSPINLMRNVIKSPGLLIRYFKKGFSASFASGINIIKCLPGSLDGFSANPGFAIGAGVNNMGYSLILPMSDNLCPSSFDPKYWGHSFSTSVSVGFGDSDETAAFGLMLSHSRRK